MIVSAVPRETGVHSCNKGCIYCWKCRTCAVMVFLCSIVDNKTLSVAYRVDSSLTIHWWKGAGFA